MNDFNLSYLAKNLSRRSRVYVKSLAKPRYKKAKQRVKYFLTLRLGILSILNGS